MKNFKKKFLKFIDKYVPILKNVSIAFELIIGSLAALFTFVILIILLASNKISYSNKYLIDLILAFIIIALPIISAILTYKSLKKDGLTKANMYVVIFHFLVGLVTLALFTAIINKNKADYKTILNILNITCLFVPLAGIILLGIPNILKAIESNNYKGEVAGNTWKAWLYLAPALILLIVFTVYPIINTVIIAFKEGYSPMGSIGGETYEFGIGNFVEVVNYPTFTTCLKNTLILCLLTTPLSCALALIVAVALNSIPKFSSFLQTIYFLPYVTNSIAIGMVFSMMFNIIGLTPMSVDLYNTLDEEAKTGLLSVVNASGETVTYYAGSWGLVNNLIMALGFDPIIWINQGSSLAANYAVLVIYIVWNALPFKIIILLGGLQSVNKQYYDAAKIDAASRTTVFFRITIPLLSPMIAYVVITSFIGGFKEYSSIVGIFGETMGPKGDENKLDTMVGFVYTALSSDKYGRASAASLILFAIIFAVTLINLWVSSKKVHY